MTDKIKQGEHAEQLLKDPLIEGFFTAYEKEIFTRWGEASTTEQREEWWRMKTAADAFKNHLWTYVVSGRIEKDKQEKANG